MKEVLNDLDEIVNLVETKKVNFRVASIMLKSRPTAADRLKILTPHLELASNSERLYNLVQKITFRFVCKFCEEFCKFRSTSSGYMQTCGKKECASKASVTTIKMNYLKKGVSHHFKSDAFRESYKKTMLQKYGSENFFSSERGKEIIKDRLSKKFGVTNVSRIPEVMQRMINSRTSRITENYQKELESRKEKIVEWRKNGYTHVKCSACNNTSKLSNTMFVIRTKNGEKCCTTCNPFSYFSSTGEKELAEFIRSVLPNATIILNDRSTGKESDIFIPERKIAFEFNGTFWHSELYKPDNFHIEKTEHFLSNGISLFHVWQDDWENRTEIVKSRIRRALNSSEHVIHARKCYVSSISSRAANSFYKKNHLQGKVSGIKFSFALILDGQILSAVSFGTNRFKKDEIELLRQSTVSNTTVIGGFQKLMKHVFRKLPELDRVITYCDRAWGKADFYERAGFKFLSNTVPDFWYVQDGLRINRFAFRKSVLVKQGYDEKLSEHEIMIERGIYRIYGCGSSKWELSNEKG